MFTKLHEKDYVNKDYDASGKTNQLDCAEDRFNNTNVLLKIGYTVTTGGGRFYKWQ